MAARDDRVARMPTPTATPHARTDYRWIALASLVVLAVGLIGVIVGLVILGKQDDSVQDAITGLATIGAGLTGGFAGWFARGVEQARDQRPTDEQA